MLCTHNSPLSHGIVMKQKTYTDVHVHILAISLRPILEQIVSVSVLIVFSLSSRWGNTNLKLHHFHLFWRPCSTVPDVAGSRLQCCSQTGTMTQRRWWKLATTGSASVAVKENMASHCRRPTSVVWYDENAGWSEETRSLVSLTKKFFSPKIICMRLIVKPSLLHL